MRPPKYPLEPLAELREKKVDDAVHGLAAAVARVDAAARERRAAEARRDAHQTATDRVRDAEARALVQGELRAADLARAGAWELRVAAERDAIASDVQGARAGEAQARDGAHRAQAEVAARQADAGVVAKDRARWSDRLRRQSEANEEEAAAETWRPRR